MNSTWILLVWKFAIIATVLDLLDRENVNLPLYEQQLRETETGIENLLNAIQQGILTKSTKTRLEELEATKEDLEIKILNEKLAKPKIEPEFLRMYLLKFRQLERDKEEHRKMLVGTFVNAIYLYDDKLVITFNYRDGSKTITLSDVETALDKENIGSDLASFGVLNRKGEASASPFLFNRRWDSKGRPDRREGKKCPVDTFSSVGESLGQRRHPAGMLTLSENRRSI